MFTASKYVQELWWVHTLAQLADASAAQASTARSWHFMSNILIETAW
jgi:hypothetical protein